MDPLVWAAIVITALVVFAPCAFLAGYRLGHQDAQDVPSRRREALFRAIAQANA